MSLVAREVERNGIPTVCVLNLRKVAERIAPPRTLLVNRPMGALLGEPGDRRGQRARVQAALALLSDAAAQPGEIRAYES